MNPLIQLKTTPPLLIALALLGFALLPKAQAVSPAPDGGYPGGNTAEGQSAFFSLTSGGYNTAVGYYSLRSNTTGNFNTAIGAGTLLANTADNNTATGTGALLSNSTGEASTANGVFALISNTTGIENTAVGYKALYSNSTGSKNIALGWLAGQDLTAGDYNIDIGNFGVAGESGAVRIGTTGVHTTTYLAGIAGQTVGAGGSTCYVDNAGKLGVFLSARRFKTDIADMAAASEGLLALRPVTFHYKPELDKSGIPQFGLVAEEVAKVNPDLVTQDAKGELSTVRYEAVNAMLLNEFLKEHRKVQEQEASIKQLKSTVAKQEATISGLKKDMGVLTTQLKEQAAQIQKVSAQLEMNHRPPQMVVNNH
jgi:uncharacterized coiled-coil protein SlyX